MKDDQEMLRKLVESFGEALEGRGKKEKMTREAPGELFKASGTSDTEQTRQPSIRQGTGGRRTRT